MKIWWVLAWDQYYPGRGLQNVHSTHDTKEQAEEEAGTVNCDHVEIVNVSDLLGIEKKKEQDWGEDE